jgi:hypothetical protein
MGTMMPGFSRSIPTVILADRAAQTYSDRIRDAVTLLLKGADRDAQLIKDILVNDSAPLTIEHGLGRPYQGYRVDRADGPISIWDIVGTYPERQLILGHSGTATRINLWVY